MMLLGKKVGMSKMYDEKGVSVPVTLIQAGPCAVLQVKTPETDGYHAVQIGFDDVKENRRKKPEVGHAAKANAVQKAFIREDRLKAASEYTVGQELTVTIFEEIKYVDVTGTSKGKGFAGVMKRHHFKGMDGSHGCERMHRHGGSIGSGSASRGTSRAVRKGRKMSGHMGAERCTVKNLKIMGIDTVNNLIIVKGAVVGANNGYVMVKKAKTSKNN